MPRKYSGVAPLLSIILAYPFSRDNKVVTPRLITSTPLKYLLPLLFRIHDSSRPIQMAWNDGNWEMLDIQPLADHSRPLFALQIQPLHVKTKRESGNGLVK
ncbi:hypothetical protein AVEN_103677-1 [Araneus ventricosus]|uniref:Uncharacterized protein n=1 Tax=Araneus ventricosus TaxID=182803 RepID=A0A4Y2G6J3_ARAVE|nr:hypothetical protein AVEN_103677-1 [Araneus ventricosus]